MNGRTFSQIPRERRERATTTNTQPTVKAMLIRAKQTSSQVASTVNIWFTVHDIPTSFYTRNEDFPAADKACKAIFWLSHIHKREPSIASILSSGDPRSLLHLKKPTVEGCNVKCQDWKIAAKVTPDNLFLAKEDMRKIRVLNQSKNICGYF